MERAVVAIGVNRTGGLPELKAAASGARAFAAWAREDQRIPDDRVSVLTDEHGKVTRDAVLEAITGMTDLGFVEQLLVYFSGHGINVGLGEQWLLSDAPKNSGAAVNVVGSEYAARFCGIGHVVFISDACRTAAPDLQTQRVTGGDIFPNTPPEGEERPVDQFFATLVGRPALEVRMADGSTDRYVAAYTTVLLDALGGKAPDIITTGDDRRLIRPAALKRHLAVAVPDFLRKSIVGSSATQQPDARITSGEIDAWLAEFPIETPAVPEPASDESVPTVPTVGGRIRARRSRPHGRVLPGDLVLPAPFGGTPMATGGLVSVGREHLLAALFPEAEAAKRRARDRQPTPSRVTGIRELFDRSMSRASLRDDAPHIPGDCGVTIRGSRIAEAITHDGDAEAAVEGNGRSVSVSLPAKRRAATIALRLVDRSLVLIPVLRGLIVSLRVDEDGHLDDVAYEPRDGVAGGGSEARTAAASRALRDVIAASATLGVLRVDRRREADALADRLRTLRRLDPGLAVSAAYAFHDGHQRGAIAALAARMEHDYGVRLFDCAMLSRGLAGHAGNRRAERAAPLPLCPFVPMRTVGWALLAAFGVAIAGDVATLRGDLRPSVWTHFEPAATRTVVRLVREGAAG